MLAFYGSRISEHMTKTPEGFLICHSVPIARTGRQDYLPREIGMSGDRMIPVFRTEEEVFSPATVASFEGKPVSEDHPPTAVTAENYAMYLKGHAQNVRRGKGDESDCLLADLIINDTELIRRIENGLREVSCGYECSYEQDERGRILQSQIRGNHIAVVAAGRAGARVSIKDASPQFIMPTRGDQQRAGGQMKGAESPMKKTSLFGRMFAKWTQDADPDEIAAAVDAMVEEDPAEAPALPKKDGVPTPMPTTATVKQPDDPAVGQPAADSDETLVALLKQILAKLDGSAKVAPKDPLAQLTDELEGKLPAVEPAKKEELPPTADQEESVTVPAEELRQDEEPDEAEKEGMPVTAKDSAATVAAIKAMRPFIAMLPEKERRNANDSITQAVRQARGLTAHPAVNGYEAILRMQRRQAQRKTEDSAKSDANLGDRIMAKYNPHYKK